MNKVKVLQVIGGMNRAGAETMLMNIFRNIDKDHFQFDFLYFNNKRNDYDDEIESLGGKIIKIVSPNKGYIKFYLNLKKAIRDNGPYSIVHSHTLFNSGLVAKAAACCKIKKIITHSHSTHNRTKGNLFSFIYCKVMRKLICRYSTDYFACNKEAGNYLFGKDFFDKNGLIIRNSIDAQKYVFNLYKKKEVLHSLGIHENFFVIGHIGRFENVKNHDFLIDIFNEIQKEKPNSVLLLIGGGTLENKIKEKASALNIENKVKFLGVRKDIPDLLQAMDVFVLPSIFEGFPVVLIEAQASGLKCIVSSSIARNTNISGLVDFISLTKSAKEWADLIIKYENGYIRSNTKQLVINAGYDISHEIKLIEELYLK